MILRRVAAITTLVVVSSAHVGSPDAWFEGAAGPYHVTVQVRTPGVVPGVAKVFARVAGQGVEQVTMQVNRYDAIAAAPPPEVAAPVPGDTGLYSAALWVMAGGSNSVTVNVSGSLGSGKAVIPVVVVANRRLALDPRLGATLSVVGLFLFVGLITIIGAAVRESGLPPGEKPDAKRRTRARVAMAASAAFLALALFGGLKWWNAEDANFTASIYKPLKASAVLSADTKVLDLRISDSVWMMRNDTAWLNHRPVSRWSPLIHDHGKLIHVFMIREPDLLAFAHLHPQTKDSVEFPIQLPSLPAGRYRVYGDIVHESGFTQTLTTTVDIPASLDSAQKPSDADDASYVASTAPDASRAVLEDGSVMTLESGGAAIVAGREAPLHFTVTGENAKPLALEPYIGMAGHAVV
ncbi:MAG TPA: hypothetical protein VGD02_11025, partial [Gemmatimonadaceae bacterium]